MKTIHQLAITIAISVFSSAAFAATQTVNGLSWTYIVSNNVAIVGNGNTTAISESSEANIRHLVVRIVRIPHYRSRIVSCDKITRRCQID